MCVPGGGGKGDEPRPGEGRKPKDSTTIGTDIGAQPAPVGPAAPEQIDHGQKRPEEVPIQAAPEPKKIEVPAPAPIPTIVQSAPSIVETAAQKLRRLKRLQMGIGSTIKSDPKDTAPALVSTPSLYSTGTKEKLGM
jgi:hypothetical protein